MVSYFETEIDGLYQMAKKKSSPVAEVLDQPLHPLVEVGPNFATALSYRTVRLSLRFRIAPFNRIQWRNLTFRTSNPLHLRISQPCETKQVNFPWPLSPRDSFVVQDFLLRGQDGMDGQFIVTYNHDIDHDYFAPRSGFVRMKVKHQGLVTSTGKKKSTRYVDAQCESSQAYNEYGTQLTHASAATQGGVAGEY